MYFYEEIMFHSILESTVWRKNVASHKKQLDYMKFTCRMESWWIMNRTKKKWLFFDNKLQFRKPHKFIKVVLCRKININSTVKRILDWFPVVKRKLGKFLVNFKALNEIVNSKNLKEKFWIIVKCGSLKVTTLEMENRETWK